MPHSSGGGSHGGGSHGGSSHGSSGPRTSSHYFRGARTFVFYRNGHAHYVHSEADLTNPTTKPKLWLTLIFILPFFIVLGIIAFNMFVPPQKLQNTEQYQIQYFDEISVLGDTTQLTQVLEAFKAETGITVAVHTATNEKWINDMSSNGKLEQYAYNFYVNHYSDETHWLIVYTHPQGTTERAAVQWYWEGMQGNDTDSILTSSKLSSFNKNLQNCLNQTTTYTVGGAIAKAFSDFTPDVMKVKVEFVDFFVIIIPTIILLIFVISIIASYKKMNYKPDELTEIHNYNPNQSNTDVCKYCNNEYVIGIHDQCPSCGVMLPLEHQRKE